MEHTYGEDLRRLEVKVDKLTDAVQRLILIEERQNTQGERLGNCEAVLAGHTTAINNIDSKVERWVNRGIGVWVAVGAVFAILKYGAEWFK